jgi:hypothetical protein
MEQLGSGRQGAPMIESSNQLTRYREKWDFEKTAEPSGVAAVKASNRRRFVI